MFDRFGNYCAAVFAALALTGLALVLALSASHERGRWLAHGCNTDTDCQRMADYLCSKGAADACEGGADVAE